MNTYKVIECEQKKCYGLCKFEFSDNLVLLYNL